MTSKIVAGNVLIIIENLREKRENSWILGQNGYICAAGQGMGFESRVCLEVFSIFPPFVLVKNKTLQKAKKLFKVSLLSLSKDSLVNCFWENLSFCQFILVFNCDLR